MDIEPHNHKQIEMLNQRGGRTLSIVDLIQAGTISVEMAACAFRAMAEGASLLTGAVPGGAGKTTLMAAVLGFLPPDVPIVTVDRPGVVAEALGGPSDRPACYLVHEIGAGHWYGYLWGRHVAGFLSLIAGRRRVASCLHADTLEELTGILCSAPLGAGPASLGRVGLILFMQVARGPRGIRRRVAAFHEADGRGGHRLLFQWDAHADAFRRVALLRDPAGLGRYVECVERLVHGGEARAPAVRRKVIEFYRSAPGPAEAAER